jgi:hypothetical protein
VGFLIEALFDALVGRWASNKSRRATKGSVAPHRFGPHARREFLADADVASATERIRAIVQRYGTERRVGNAALVPDAIEIEAFVSGDWRNNGTSIRITVQPADGATRVTVLTWAGGFTLIDWGASKRTAHAIGGGVLAELGAHEVPKTQRV